MDCKFSTSNTYAHFSVFFIQLYSCVVKIMLKKFYNGNSKKVSITIPFSVEGNANLRRPHFDDESFLGECSQLER